MTTDPLLTYLKPIVTQLLLQESSIRPLRSGSILTHQISSDGEHVLSLSHMRVFPGEDELRVVKTILTEFGITTWMYDVLKEDGRCLFRLRWREHKLDTPREPLALIEFKVIVGVQNPYIWRGYDGQEFRIYAVTAVAVFNRPWGTMVVRSLVSQVMVEQARIGLEDMMRIKVMQLGRERDEREQQERVQS